MTAFAVIACCGALATGGGVLGARALIAGEHGRPTITRTAPADRSWNAVASFGPVAVSRVERLAGAPGTGAHHEDEEPSDRIRVSITLTNRLARAVPYSPGEFRLGLADRGGSVPPTRPNPPPGSIPAGETLRQRLTFIVPAPRTTFTLTFDDLGRATPLAISLGSLPGREKE